jgi:hypothetical protein
LDIGLNHEADEWRADGDPRACRPAADCAAIFFVLMRLSSFRIAAKGGESGIHSPSAGVMDSGLAG